MAQHYRQDNTHGYTDAELASLNDELNGILADAACRGEDSLTLDDVERIIKQHNDEVAGR